MVNLTAQQASSSKNNRRKLRRAVTGSELIIITGHSFLQASADRPLPFEQDSSFFYLSGINEPGITLVMDKDDEYLIVPERSQTRQAFEGSIDRAELSRLSGIDLIYDEEEGWQKLGKRLTKSTNAGVLKPIDSYIKSIDMFANPSRQRLLDRLREYNSSLDFIDLRSQLMQQRMIKTKYEIKMIQQAIKHTQKLFTVIERKRRSAVYEHDLLAEINKQTTKQQLSYAYEPIIASGSNAVTLHYIKNNAVIDKKALLLLDIGLKYQGYCADLTRTISYSPTKRQRQVYQAVLSVQEYAISLLKPGITLKAYEENILQCMSEKLQELGLIRSTSKKDIRRFYPHGTSHFLGLDVHDPGDYERPLEPGMVMTVEPGIYIREEAIGIRIEDDVLITKEGNQVLTNKLPKNIASLTI